MPLDPHAQFDQSVMEMIEHSPIGAVPHTTSYVESLTRLYAAHQVYPSADHKGGHVTARSLAGRPAFFAANLEGMASGQTKPEALESNAKIFDRYVQSLPPGDRQRAELHRAKATGKPPHHRKHHGSDAISVHHDPVHSLFLLPGTGIHPGLPGNYLYGSFFQSGSDAASSAWAVHCMIPTMGRRSSRHPTWLPGWPSSMSCSIAPLSTCASSKRWDFARIDAGRPGLLPRPIVLVLGLPIPETPSKNP